MNKKIYTWLYCPKCKKVTKQEQLIEYNNFKKKIVHRCFECGVIYE